MVSKDHRCLRPGGVAPDSLEAETLPKLAPECTLQRECTAILRGRGTRRRTYLEATPSEKAVAHPRRAVQPSDPVPGGTTSIQVEGNMLLVAQPHENATAVAEYKI